MTVSACANRRDGRAFDILLVEPDSESVSRFTESLEAAANANTVTIVPTSADALDFVNQRGDYTEAPRPDLVLLDLHLPDASGTEVLAEIKNHPQIRQVPILVLTSSDAPEDINQSYELHANAYLQKPASPDESDQLVQAIEDFWLNYARLPPKEQ
ncbi:response regulator [Natronosalvus rutilus]|uniref:Response regulator n=1 Tax=Natronosalvus rutilus TaxID=2953753 RepID=A0A9E7SVR5_9EURY|nr:response regulator [Natronosalvus rutilus]UTF53261.1 response regulator [Natronosalvus rutilus]